MVSAHTAQDRTQDVARSCGASVLTSPRGRSLQMNFGAKSTKAGAGALGLSILVEL